MQIAVIVLFGAGCGPSDKPATLNVEFAGCAALWTDAGKRVCAPSGETLTIWARTSDKKAPVITVDGRQLDLVSTQVQGGVQFANVPVPAAGLLAVVAGDGSRAARFELTLSPQPDLAAGFDPKTVELATLREAIRTAAGSQRARLLSRLGRRLLRTPEWQQGLTTLGEARLMHRQLDRPKDVIWDTLATAHMTTARTHDVAAATALINDLDTELKAAPEGAANAYYTSAVIAYTAGNPRRALSQLAEARRAATRLAQAGALARVAQLESLVYTAIGRFDDASRVARAAVEAATKPAATDTEARGAYAELQNNLAWALVRRYLSEPGLADDAGGNGNALDALLAEALAGFQAAKRPSDAADVIVNQGLLACSRSDSNSAATALSALTAAPPSERRVLWRLELKGCVALLTDDLPTAEAAYGELAARADLARDLAGRWRGELGQARAQRAAKRYKDAAKTLRQAEATAERHLFSVPLGAGREAFVGDREASARLLVDVLVTDGDTAGAFSAARRARTRALRMADRDTSLQRLTDAEETTRVAAMARYLRARDALDKTAANDWQLSATELATSKEERLARLVELDKALDTVAVESGSQARTAAQQQRPVVAGEVLLGFFPGVDRWFGFITEHPTQETKVVDLGPLPSNAAERRRWALVPFEKQLLANTSVTLLTFGALDGVDLHAFMLEPNKPLAVVRVAAYALDVPTLATATTISRLLLVADPSQDLPKARSRGRALAGKAPEGVFLQGAQATGAAVRRELATAGAFFFAGHANYSGPDGLNSALKLADGAELRVNDILALAHAPRTVVLAGCETGKTGASRAAGLGLGQAFIMRGAETVIATTRPIRDDVAGRFTDAMGPVASRAGYQKAMASLASDVPTDQWSALRLWIP